MPAKTCRRSRLYSGSMRSAGSGAMAGAGMRNPNMPHVDRRTGVESTTPRLGVGQFQFCRSCESLVLGGFFLPALGIRGGFRVFRGLEDRGLLLPRNGAAEEDRILLVAVS